MTHTREDFSEEFKKKIINMKACSGSWRLKSRKI
jgi:hypothetical protein